MGKLILSVAGITGWVLFTVGVFFGIEALTYTGLALAATVAALVLFIDVIKNLERDL